MSATVIQFPRQDASPLVSPAWSGATAPQLQPLNTGAGSQEWVVLDGGRSNRGRARAAVYRRRRLMVLLVVLTLGYLLSEVVSSAVASFGEPVATSSSSVSAVASSSYVVAEGDTLWSVAKRIQPASDPREVVDALIEANGTETVVPGQRLSIPRELRATNG